MKKQHDIIKVFEYELLPIGDKFKERHLKALSKLNALHNDVYFDIRYKGVRFKNFVGIVQIDGLTIEILPKIDANESDKDLWQQALIKMLKTTKKLKVQKVGQANVKKQNIHLLDIYFEWFLTEVELLIRQGLIKQYYTQTKNVSALKGKLEFAGHIQKNLIHKELFYTTHQIYEKDHLIHQILSFALSIIEDFSKGTYLYSRCKTVQLDFPEVKHIRINKTTFSRIKKSRKSAPYKDALEIARFIILNYAPNISSGDEKMLALLFDMNNLWEEYVLVKMKQAAQKRKDTEVYGQRSKEFWQGITIRPDIVVKKPDQVYVIDTKWKNIQGFKPSTQDLRQMYVYNEYWNSVQSMLLYPASTTVTPDFRNFKEKKHQCAVGRLNIIENGKLNAEIGKEILDWYEFSGLKDL
jgi:5-methylcytosine-specific restriction enzyme subunit McrC